MVVSDHVGLFPGEADPLVSEKTISRTGSTSMLTQVLQGAKKTTSLMILEGSDVTDRISRNYDIMSHACNVTT